MVKIFKYSFFDLVRNWWFYGYFAFYFITTIALLTLSTDLSRAIASLVNIVIVLSPLIGTLFGVMYYYNSREFIELLLAQPIRRRDIFLGQYLGLAISLSLSFALGLGLPFLFYGISGSGLAGNFFTLLMTGILLTFIFTALAVYIALRHENHIKGFGTALMIWLFMAVIYDGIFLLSLVLLQEYPIDKLALGLTMLNPVDLARILMMLQLDISALMGYTGAVFNKFFGTQMGILVSLGVSLVWVVIPVGLILRFGQRKDF